MNPDWWLRNRRLLVNRGKWSGGDMACSVVWCCWVCAVDAHGKASATVERYVGTGADMCQTTAIGGVGSRRFLLKWRIEKVEIERFGHLRELAAREESERLGSGGV